MARPKIDEARVDEAFDDFRAGLSLREIATKSGISERTLATISKKEDWVKQREAETAKREDARVSAMAPELLAAVEKRVEVLTRNQRDRLKFIGDQVGMLSVRLSEELATQDLSSLSPGRKLALLKMATEIYSRVRVANEETKGSGMLNVHMDFGGSTSSEAYVRLKEENEQMRSDLQALREEHEALRLEYAKMGSIRQIVRLEVSKATGRPLQEEEKHGSPPAEDQIAPGSGNGNSHAPGA